MSRGETPKQLKEPECNMQSGMRAGYFSKHLYSDHALNDTGYLVIWEDIIMLGTDIMISLTQGGESSAKPPTPSAVVSCSLQGSL